jgi:hypothetical protein
VHKPQGSGKNSTLVAFPNCKVSVLLAALAVATGFYSVHLGMDQMWDLGNYHLYNPFAALHDRYLYDIAPAQLQTYFNPLLDLPFFFMIEFFNDWPRSIAFLQGTIHGVNLLCVALIAWHVLGGVEGISRALRLALTAIALLIGATGAGSMPLIGTATGDLQVAVPILLALLLLIRAIDLGQNDSRHTLQAIAFSGVLAGFAAAAKLTMAVFGIAMAAAILVLPRGLLIKASLRFAGAGIAGVLLGGGLHFFEMWRLFGNPLFPLFNNVFRSPYWEATAGRDGRWLPQTLSDWLFRPFEWAHYTGNGIVSEGGFRDIRIALALMLGGLAALTWIVLRLTRSAKASGVSPSTRALIIFVIVAYLIWLPAFSYYRYLVPLELLSGVLIVLALGAIVRGRVWLLLSLAAAGLSIGTTIPLEWGHAAFRDRYFAVRGPAIAPDTLVIIIGVDPVAYLAPFFDRQVRWVGVENSFLNLDKRNLLMQRVQDLIQEHRGPLLMLQAGARDEDVEAALSRFSLARGPGECESIWSNFREGHYSMCPLVLMPSTSRHQ